jgi:phage recombination protein Bet
LSDAAQQDHPEPAVEPSTAVAVPDGTYHAPRANVLARKRAFSDPKTVDLIRATVAKECDNSELAMFLELAARYDLDPFAGQIYAAKIDGKMVMIVARDGLLSIANRHRDYAGNSGDVVREFDYFEKWVDEQTGHPRLVHKYGLKHDDDGPIGTTGDPDDRGKIVGAWSIVFRKDRAPTYAYASFKAYNKGKFTWKSHPDAMMKKVPLVMALREAFSITGVVGEGEVDAGGPGTTGPSSLTDAPVDDYGQDPGVAAKIVQLFDLLGYTQRKRTITLAGELGTGLSDDGRRQLVAWLLQQAEEKDIVVPPLPHEDAIDGEAVEEEEVTATPA